MALLLITFIGLMVSAYHRYRMSVGIASLADATSDITSHLALEDLAYLDNSGRKHAYVVNPIKINTMENFRRNISGENIDFNVELTYRGSDNEKIIGPRGAEQPADKSNCVLILPVMAFDNNRFTPAKLKVVAWRA